MKRWLLLFLIILLFVGSILIFFYDVTFFGKTFKISTMYAQALPYGPYGQSGNFSSFRPVIFCDTAPLEEPFSQFLKISFQKGIFPLWNPHQLCGTSMGLMMEGGVFFPLNIISYVLPNAISLDVLILVRILISGLLVYWLMSVWGFGFLLRIVAALIFMFTGPMVVNHLWTANADMLLPLLFLVSYKTFKNPSIRHYSFFSLAIGLSVLSGHVEHIFLTHFLTVLYLVFLFWQDVKRKKPGLARKMLTFLGFYILGIGISSAALFPFIDDFFRSWTSHTGSTGLMNPEPRNKILTILVPGFFSKGFSVDGIRYTWVGGYLGVIATSLAFLGLWSGKKKALVWFLGGVAILIFGKMFGFVYAQWIGYLPIFNMILLTWHLSHIFAFLIALLAAFGCQELLDNFSGSFKKLIVIATILILFILGSLWVYRQASFFPQALATSGFSLLLLAVVSFGLLFLTIKKKRQAGLIAVTGLVILMLVELFVLNPRYRVKRFDSFPPVPYIEFLKNKQKEFYSRTDGRLLAFYQNTAMAYGLDSFGGHQSIYPNRYVEFVEGLVSPGFFRKIEEKGDDKGLDQRFDSRNFLSISNVKHLVFGKRVFPKELCVYDNEVQIVSLPVVAPRAYLSYGWDFEEKGAKGIVDKIKERGGSAVSRVIIEKDSQESLPQSDLSGQGIIFPVEIEKAWANGLVLRAQAEKQCFLILLDAYHPGWKAWVNGKPSKVYPANYLFRAVLLEPGDNIVEFRFVPFWFYFGLWISLLSLGVCATLFLRTFLRGSRKPHNNSS